MLVFRVKHGPNKLYLIDSLGRVTEFACGSEPFGARRDPQPELIEPREGQVKFDFVTRTVFAEIEGHQISLEARYSFLSLLTLRKSRSLVVDGLGKEEGIELLSP